MTNNGDFPRIAPLRATNNTSVIHGSYPADVSQQGAFDRLPQVLTRQGFKDHLSVYGKDGLNAETT
eukprot:2847353-Pyramimonas_sp.AAC.1